MQEKKEKNKIIDIGIDVADINRFVEKADDAVFLNRLLTDSERDYVFLKKHPHRHIAGRFAAKEAVMKALGTGWDKGIGWADIEIKSVPGAKPVVILHNAAKKLGAGKKIFLSIAYTRKCATAFAVMEEG